MALIHGDVGAVGRQGAPSPEAFPLLLHRCPGEKLGREEWNKAGSWIYQPSSHSGQPVIRTCA